MKINGNVREYIFEREQGICRCCRLRRAESMHELRFRSLGGKVSRFNSVAVCGMGGHANGCHEFLQSLAIDWQTETPALGADWLLQFMPKTQAAADWMRVPIGIWVASMPGGRQEEMEAC